jgi:hypothetical protein
MKSTFLSLNWADFFKGLVVAVLTPIFPIVQQSITNGVLTFDWHVIEVAAAGGFVAYLVKNFFTDTNKAAVKTLEKQNVTVTERQL